MIMETSLQLQAQAVPNDHATGVDGGDAPIDHAHLARYTLGNRSLELEVLQLFADQAPATLQELRAATCAKEWHIAAHTLKGSARAVGARGVAMAAEIAEVAGHADARRAELISAVEANIDEVRTYISRLQDARGDCTLR